MGIKTINIVAGGRYTSELTYSALTNSGYDVRIYSSSPKKYFKTVPSEKITLVPKFFQIAQKVLRRRMPRFLHDFDAGLFDLIISKIMRPADLIWGYNGNSLMSGKVIKNNGGGYVLDRPCPHLIVQADLMRKEAGKIGYPYAYPTKRGIKRFTDEYEICDAIVVPSRWTMGSFITKGVPAKKIHYIPLDVNPSQKSGSSAMPMKIGNGELKKEFRVGIVGGSFLRKGIIYLLRAINILNKPDMVLYIRATESNVTQHPEAKTLCEKLGVIFVPYLDDINEFYQSLDVFVLPSVDEGFGMVLFEALRNGTPAMASQNVGAIDGLKPEEEIVLFPAGDEIALAQVLDRLYCDQKLRKKIGKAGQEYYQKKINKGGSYQRDVGSLVAMLAEK